MVTVSMWKTEMEQLRNLNKRQRVLQKNHDNKIQLYKRQVQLVIDGEQKLNEMAENGKNITNKTTIENELKKNKAKMEENRNRALKDFKELLAIEEQFLAIEARSGLKRKNFQIH